MSLTKKLLPYVKMLIKGKKTNDEELVKRAEKEIHAIAGNKTIPASLTKEEMRKPLMLAKRISCISQVKPEQGPLAYPICRSKVNPGLHTYHHPEVENFTQFDCPLCDLDKRMKEIESKDEDELQEQIVDLLDDDKAVKSQVKSVIFDSKQFPDKIADILPDKLKDILLEDDNEVISLIKDLIKDEKGDEEDIDELKERIDKLESDNEQLQKMLFKILTGFKALKEKIK